MSSRNKIGLYQYGDFVFGGEDLSVTRNLQLETQLANSEYMNGKIRPNKMNPDYTDDTIYDVEFTVRDGKLRHQMTSLFYQKPQKMFFIEEYKDRQFVGSNNKIDGDDTDYRVYFAYGHVLAPPQEKYFGHESTADEYKMRIRQIGRKFLLEDNRLRFIRFSDEKSVNNKWEDNQGLWEVDDLGNWESDYNTPPAVFAKMSQKGRQELIDCCDPIGFFEYDDLFFAQEVAQIDANGGNICNFTINGLQGVTAPHLLNLANINQVSTAPNETIVIEIQKLNLSFPAIASSQWIEIFNPSTQTGFRISARNNTCPNRISIFVHKQIKLFDTLTNKPINYLSPDSPQYNAFVIENISQSNSFFTLSNFVPIYENVNPTKNDTITISRNFQTQTNIKIASLPTFY